MFKNKILLITGGTGSFGESFLRKVLSSKILFKEIRIFSRDEKSQHKNKAKGLKILRARLYEIERSRIDKERSIDRKSKIGTGDRSERIRTYNFPQGRVTDHRINLTIHRLDEFLEGEAFDEMIESLTLQAQEESLNSL